MVLKYNLVDFAFETLTFLEFKWLLLKLQHDRLPFLIENLSFIDVPLILFFDLGQTLRQSEYGILTQIRLELLQPRRDLRHRLFYI